MQHPRVLRHSYGVEAHSVTTMQTKQLLLDADFSRNSWRILLSAPVDVPSVDVKKSMSSITDHKIQNEFTVQIEHKTKKKNENVFATMTDGRLLLYVFFYAQILSSTTIAVRRCLCIKCLKLNGAT